MIYAKLVVPGIMGTGTAVRIELHGHANQGKPGSDPACAAVSAAFDMVTGTGMLTGVLIPGSVKIENGSAECRLQPLRTGIGLAHALAMVLQKTEEEWPGSVELDWENV